MTPNLKNQSSFGTQPAPTAVRTFGSALVDKYSKIKVQDDFEQQIQWPSALTIGQKETPGRSTGTVNNHALFKSLNPAKKEDKSMLMDFYTDKYGLADLSKVTGQGLARPVPPL